MKTNAETLEFNLIKEQVQEQCACSLGIERVQRMHHHLDIDVLKHELSYVEEAMQLISHYGYLPLGGLHDVTYLLRKADMDGMLLPKELLNIQDHVHVCQAVDHYYQENELDTPYFNDACEQLVILKDLQSRIEHAILPDGTVSDQASAALSQIRRKMKQLEGQVRQKMDQLLVTYKDALSDHLSTTRHDRFVLPVRSDRRHQVPGIVHGFSSSNQTIYVEPDIIVSLNNQLSSLKDEEQQEIERILRELSGRVKYDKAPIEANQTFLGILDFEFAKARFGEKLSCCIPDVVENSEHFILKEARHPLIDPKKVVANTISLSSPERLLLITGSNTGGKTVTLKMAGLLSLMALSGLPIPCLEAVIPHFDEIYVDLGDEQSIEQSLSTFSSHMSRLIDISDHMSHASLVLLDEIGSGTDPREGESLAEAFLTYMVDIQCFGLVSTHYSSLKRFALTQQHVGIASVEFDMEKMMPTYRLIPSMAGHSYAFEISERLGLKACILDKAREIKLSKQDDVEGFMERLENELEKQRQKEEALQQQASLLAQREIKLAQKEEKMLKAYENYQEKAQEEANHVIEEAMLKVDQIMKTLNEEHLKPHIATQAKRQLEEAMYQHEELLEKGDENYPYQVGDQVYILSMKRQGEVTGLRNQQVSVSIGGLNLHLKKSDLRFISKKPKVKKVVSGQVSVKKSSSMHYECHIIGMRYEEAMNEVDKFLDDALLHHYSSVRIVHGMGTGALRKGVHTLLKKHSAVDHFRDGGANEGGLGATIVYFK